MTKLDELDQLIDDVIDICFAYEQGYGHGKQNRKLKNPHKENSSVSIAWNHGYVCGGHNSLYKNKQE